VNKLLAQLNADLEGHKLSAKRMEAQNSLYVSFAETYRAQTALGAAQSTLSLG
jgi:hypothetical protein